MPCTQSDSNHYPRQLPSSTGMHPEYIIYWHREPTAPSSTHLKISCEPVQVVHVQVCSVLLCTVWECRCDTPTENVV